jgi:hypothetical protein
MTTEALIRLAIGMLRSNPKYEADARQHAAGGNSIVGDLLVMETNVGRQIAETAVCAALIRMDREFVCSLCPIDIGFDLRTTKTAVHLPAEVTAVVIPGRTITGSRQEITRELQSLGYSVSERGWA